jgi:hypothetical protein
MHKVARERNQTETGKLFNSNVNVIDAPPSVVQAWRQGVTDSLKVEGRGSNDIDDDNDGGDDDADSDDDDDGDGDDKAKKDDDDDDNGDGKDGSDDADDGYDDGKVDNVDDVVDDTGGIDSAMIGPSLPSLSSPLSSPVTWPLDASKSIYSSARIQTTAGLRFKHCELQLGRWRVPFFCV